MSLRTVANILVANLAVVDILNVAVNLPFHMISSSEASWYRGQTLAIVTAFLNRVFAIFNLAQSRLAMMANVLLAIAFDLVPCLENKEEGHNLCYSYLVGKPYGDDLGMHTTRQHQSCRCSRP